MNRKQHTITRLLTVLSLVWFAACNSTKYIPEGEYLLDKVSLNIQDEGAQEADLLPFVQQTPVGSLAAGIYNLVPNDSSWFKRQIRKMGDEPIIFSPTLTNLSAEELKAELGNMGYLNAQVNSQVDTLNKKAEVTYTITNNAPYFVRNYAVEIPQLRNNANQNRNNANRNTSNKSSNRKPRERRNRSLIKEGTIFSMDILEQERSRISSSLRNQGYYTSTVENLHYLADTTLNSNQVDLNLVLLDSATTVPYTIQRVNVYSGYDQLDKNGYKIVDSLEYKGIHIYYDSLHFLRSSVINEKILVRPERLFRERQSDATYELLRSLDCVGRVDMQYAAGNYPDSTLLDCNIILTPGNIHSLQVGVEGTNKAGDLGVALDVTYGHQNLFNGSEIFNIHLRGAYEFVDGSSGEDGLNHNYYELEISPSITFPKLHLPWLGDYMKERFNVQTQYSLGYNIQKRPQYVRDFFNFNWKIRWQGRRQNITHSLSLLDVNYVNMPWKSADFNDYLENRVDSLTKYSYDNVFTAGINYNLIYSNSANNRLRNFAYTIRFNAETSGNVLNWICDATHASKSESGQYTVLGNPFAQYIKGDIDYSQSFRLSQKSTLASHIGLGVAYPYKNSSILPFEKRYYAGGPNSIRGWNTRYLGPGSYNEGLKGNPVTHVGDINLILSAEYRYKVLSWLEPVFFIDAGNIWTIDDYADQPGGLFQWNKFYKEIAVGTGIGLRFDLSFLILRLDAGTKVYDPAKTEGNRFVLFKEKFFKNSAFYVAIGYPF